MIRRLRENSAVLFGEFCRWTVGGSLVVVGVYVYFQFLYWLDSQ